MPLYLNDIMVQLSRFWMNDFKVNKDIRYDESEKGFDLFLTVFDK